MSIVVKISDEFELLYRECLQCKVNGYQKVLKEQNCIKYAEKTTKSIIWKNKGFQKTILWKYAEKQRSQIFTNKLIP